jgi:hypothetical protein
MSLPMPFHTQILLHRHIDKEDNVVYQFATEEPSKEVQEALEQDCTGLRKPLAPTIYRKNTWI